MNCGKSFLTKQIILNLDSIRGALKIKKNLKKLKKLSNIFDIHPCMKFILNKNMKYFKGI